MDDIELIEKYFLKQLSDHQMAEFNERLRSDSAFKKQFEIESVIFKGLQYAQEKERIKAIYDFATETQMRVNPWYSQDVFWIAGASALAAWLLSAAISSLIRLEPQYYKWIGLAVAILFAFAGAYHHRKKIELRLIPIVLVNGMLVFVTASGIDAINQGVELQSNQDKATLIPFIKKGTWWPTQSLVDSLSNEKSLTRRLEDENARLNEAFIVMQDSCFDATFDNFVPVVVPNSSFVAAGGKYEAQVFLGVSNSRQKLAFFANGMEVSGISDSHSRVEMGKIEFTATADSYDPKSLLSKKTFIAEIKLRDTTFRQEVEYFVAQPIIKVTTGNAPTLYMNCGNTVNIEVPALGTNYEPNFTAAGAAFIKGDKPGKVTIIPSQRKITVNVSNAGTPLGSVAFDVKPIPLPRYTIRDNTGKEIDKRVGIAGRTLTGLLVAAEPDPIFKEDVPKDAIYRIRNMEIIHARGATPVNRMVATNEVLDLSTWRNQFKSGDRIIIEIKTVTRRTYQGQDERIEVRNEVHNVPIQ